MIMIESQAQWIGETSHPGQMKRLLVESAKLIGCAPDDLEVGVLAADWLNISRYVAATGDENPLYLDPLYGAESWWRTQLAPPGFVLSIMVPESAGALYSGRYDAVERLSAIEILWNDHIKLGERVSAHGRFVQAMPASADLDSDGVDAVTQVVYRSERRAVAWARGRVTVKPVQSGSPPVAPREMHEYEPHEIESLEAALEAEASPRGRVPRFQSDVKIGDPLPLTTRGPITWSELQTWMVAEGRKAPAGNIRHRDLLKAPGNIRPHAATSWPVSDRRQAREDLLCCRDVGFPAPCARGAMVVALATQNITAWMGDGAFIRRIEISLPAPVLYGDTLTLESRVIDKFEQRISKNRYFAVTIDVTVRNQVSDSVAFGTVLVYLPNNGCPVELPVEEEMF